MSKKIYNKIEKIFDKYVIEQVIISRKQSKRLHGHESSILYMTRNKIR